MPASLDRDLVRRAFDLLGADIAARGAFVELAVYGGSAIMLQFSWRRATNDVDAIVREGSDEAALAPSVAVVASDLGLDPNWLNDAVGMFTPLAEDESLFDLFGSYPPGAPPGLRVFLARPPYLLALKLHALASLDRGSRDIDDARRLAAHLGMADPDQLVALYRSLYDEDPPEAARLRFSSVLEP